MVPHVNERAWWTVDELASPNRNSGAEMAVSTSMGRSTSTDELVRIPEGALIRRRNAISGSDEGAGAVSAYQADMRRRIAARLRREISVEAFQRESESGEAVFEAFRVTPRSERRAEVEADGRISRLGFIQTDDGQTAHSTRSSQETLRGDISEENSVVSVGPLTQQRGEFDRARASMEQGPAAEEMEANDLADAERSNAVARQNRINVTSNTVYLSPLTRRDAYIDRIRTIMEQEPSAEEMEVNDLADAETSNAVASRSQVNITSNTVEEAEANPPALEVAPASFTTSTSADNESIATGAKDVKNETIKQVVLEKIQRGVRRVLNLVAGR